MKQLFILICIFLALAESQAQEVLNLSNQRITSSIDTSISGEIALIQKFKVNVSIDSVWSAFTTKKGWESAFVAIAEVDFKINGTIKTSYNKDATIGDSSTIVLHIINYVPNKLLTLQAEISDHFPEFMKSEAKNFYNVLYFKEISSNETSVESYGIGYKNNVKYLSLLQFFIDGNEFSYLNLIKYLETGQAIKHK